MTSIALDLNVLVSAGIPVVVGGVGAYFMLALKVERHHGEIKADLAEVKGDVKRINGNVRDNTEFRQKHTDALAGWEAARAELHEAVAMMKAVERRRRLPSDDDEV